MTQSLQQRRQQLLGELENIHGLLREPAEDGGDTTRIPTLNDAIPQLSNTVATPIQTVPTLDTPVSAQSPAAPISAVPTRPATAATTQDSNATAAPAAAPPVPATTPARTSVDNNRALQQLIARLTQSQPLSVSTPSNRGSQPSPPPATDVVASENTHALNTENADAVVFTAVSDEPVFTAPQFTKLDLSAQLLTLPATEPAIQPPAHPTLTAPTTNSQSDGMQATNYRTLTEADIDQAILSIMPQIESLLREQLSKQLLATDATQPNG